MVGVFGSFQCLRDRAKLFLKSNGLRELLIQGIHFYLSLLLLSSSGVNFYLLLVCIGVISISLLAVCAVNLNTYADIARF